MFTAILNIFYPPKCILCRKVLEKEQTDLCNDCRKNAPEFTKAKRNIPFVARWTALWYYRDNVKRGIHRFKFFGARYLAASYGRLLGMRLLKDYPDGFDVITWVPVGFFRKLKRGYDQSRLLANAIGEELGYEPVQLLRKIRNTPPQSGIPDAAKRRANVLGAYEATNPELFTGKRVLLIDDVITTGATCSECSRVLMTAGAKEVSCAAIAAAMNHKK